MGVIVDSGSMGALWMMALPLVGCTLCALPGTAQNSAISANSTTSAAQPSPAGPTTPIPYPGGMGTPLGARIAEVLSAPAVAGAHWGIAVTAMNGTPIYGLDEAKLFRPASSAKLFTTAAALALLHPDATFSTGVYGTLEPGGVVRGDLVLFGAADADFGTHDLPYRSPGTHPPPQIVALDDLAELADKLVARGVHQITGDVIGDDGMRPFVPYAEGWSTEDEAWGYGAPVSALSIADNELVLKATPGAAVKAGSPNPTAARPTTVTLDQFGVPYYTLRTDLSSYPRAQIGDAIGVGAERLPGTRILSVHGSLREGDPPDAEHIAMDDPAAFAASAFKKTLLDHGITVDGGSAPHHRSPRDAGNFRKAVLAPGDCEKAIVEGGNCPMGCTTYTHPFSDPLAEHRSAPLIEDVVFTLKTSANLHAELMLSHLSALVPCTTGSAVEGARLVRAFLLKAGIYRDDFAFYDGSGLSTKDLVTPRSEAQLLAYAATQPWFAQWKAALPVGGVDGTLASRFTEAPLRGHVFAKTGTLGESRALAGYLQCASGLEVIFSILDDNHEPGSSADRTAMDKIVAAIAAND